MWALSLLALLPPTAFPQGFDKKGSPIVKDRYEPSGGIYKKDWIDFNKNGRMDVYEDPSRTIEERVEDLLSQMTLEEKTCQMATLYGYGRVLTDDLPNPEWKTDRIWKDGIGAIEEHLNGFPSYTQERLCRPGFRER